MNRRVAIAGTLAALIATPALARNGNQSDVLRGLIKTVIADGDTSDVGRFVNKDVTIPDFNVTGMDAFRDASDAGFADRERRYTDYAFEVVSIAESDDWAHALVRFEATSANGQSTTEHVFYVARFVDGLIAELYL